MKANRILTITNLEQLWRWWPFMVEGLEYMRKEMRWNIPVENYFSTIMSVVASGSNVGVCLILTSHSGTPYGYLVAADSTSHPNERVAQIYSMFTNNKCPSTIAELVTEAKQWATSMGFGTIRACTPRISGTSIRWFRTKLGFRPSYIIFEQKL